MKMNIKMRNLIAILALTIMTSAYADSDYVCNVHDLRKNQCIEGDFLVLDDGHLLPDMETIQHYTAFNCKLGTITIIQPSPMEVLCEYRGKSRSYRWKEYDK